MGASLEPSSGVLMRQLLRENFRELQRVLLKTELNTDWCVHVKRNTGKDFRDPCPNFISVDE